MAIKPLLIILGCMVTLVVPIAYEDCGGHGFIVKDVEVEKCSESPCIINVGESRTITVYSVNEVTNIASLESKAYVSQMGYAWELVVSPHDICLHWGGCPLEDTETRSYTGDVYFNSTLLRRPGQLMLRAKYETDGSELVAFCIRFSVQLI